MTVSDITNRTSADGSATAGQSIPFHFPILNTSDIEVKTRVILTGVEATLTETTDYTVTISDDEGGWIELVSAVAATYEIHIIRTTPRTQATDLEQGGTFSAETLEAAYDKLTRIVNDLYDGISRCIIIPDTDDATLTLTLPDSIDRASKYLSFDSDGNIQATDLAETGVVSFGAFGTTLAGTADAAAAITALGLAAIYQPLDADLTKIAALSATDSYFMVGSATGWVSEPPATARTSIGISTFGATLVDDATAAAARTTLGAISADEILCHEGSVLVFEGNILTWTA